MAREAAAAVQPINFAQRDELTLRESRRRWAALLRKVFEVDPLKRPNCATTMRIVAFITKQDIIDRIMQ